MPGYGRKLFIPSIETSFHTSKCLHCHEHALRSPLVCPCSFREGGDEPVQVPQRQVIACRWSFIESFRKFSSEFLTRSKIFFIICTSGVWLESVVRMAFVVIARRIHLIKTDCVVNQIAQVALNSDFEQDRSSDCRPEIPPNDSRESKHADLFVIELNKPLSTNNFSDLQDRVEAAAGLRFSETKV